MQSQAEVFHAVVWRIFHINEFCARNDAERVRDCATIIRAVACPHPNFVHLQLLCLTVLDFQIGADISEVSQLHPTCLNTAASRHTMALASPFECCSDGLQYMYSFTLAICTPMLQ